MEKVNMNSKNNTSSNNKIKDKGKIKGYRFRCQYQKGVTCISDSVESYKPITSCQIIISLSKLAMKVKDQLGKKAGGKVALQVLKIHEFVIRELYNKNNIGHGNSHSYYLDKRNKNKEQRSERIDIQFVGEYGAKDNQYKLIETYIKKYRKFKHWDKILQS